MKTTQKTHSDRAIEAALAAFGGHPNTALLTLFFATARRMGEVIDRESAAEFAYMAADDLATGGRK